MRQEPFFFNTRTGFANQPAREEAHAVKEIINIFGQASGLHVNYRKTTSTLIRAEGRDEQIITEILGCDLASFPIRYLGMQLTLRPLTKSQWQTLIDKAMFLLPAWQRGMIRREGRLTLVKSVLTTRPIHMLLVEQAPVWVLEEMISWIRAFL
jgi:hypothetical protein